MSTRAALDGVRVTSPVPRAVWRSLADSDPYALPTQTPQWLDAVCDGGRYTDVSQLYEWPDGHRILVPLVRKRYLPTRLATNGSWPIGWDIGGALCDQGRISKEQAAAVVERLAGQSVRATYFRPHPVHDDVWSAVIPTAARRKPRMVQTIDLRAGVEAVWKRFSSSKRRNIRKARQAALTVECDSTGRLLPIFDRLYRQSVERWATQGDTPAWLTRLRVNRKYSTRYFTSVVRHLGATCQVWVLWHEGVTTTALITVSHGGYTFALANAMDKRLSGPIHGQTYLHALAIEQACAEGRDYFHLGDTYPGTGVTRFKSSFGPVDYHSAGYWLPPTRSRNGSS
ncbi:hypothetical protein GCM10012275_19650 [Longimycelium tulufanense]|uniref:BioF2-like acetyltransferase domain-containing protein n=1 Tax=Longimycelium tulufanense TaxID=907463 RepID=A0A8J3CA47_9PSEU|nr:GNAT family N-acetyltransferase [Longimycelium tulufanense]GGM48804.1 hypothetical protein GCM10012275_19650 [Longimycelium tulufanense]